MVLRGGEGEAVGEVVGLAEDEEELVVEEAAGEEEQEEVDGWERVDGQEDESDTTDSSFPPLLPTCIQNPNQSASEPANQKFNPQ